MPPKAPKKTSTKSKGAVKRVRKGEEPIDDAVAVAEPTLSPEEEVITPIASAQTAEAAAASPGEPAALIREDREPVAVPSERGPEPQHEPTEQREERRPRRNGAAPTINIAQLQGMT